MRKHIVIAGLAAALASCSPAHNATSAVQDSSAPSPWTHETLTATDSTNIEFDYQTSSSQAANSSAYSQDIINPWLNVSSAGFTGAEQVHAVVLVFSISSMAIDNGQPVAGAGTLTNTLQVDLHWDANARHFTGQPQGPLPLSAYEEGDDQATEYYYQFAIVVNGNWLTDPASGSHNFQYLPSLP